MPEVNLIATIAGPKDKLPAVAELLREYSRLVHAEPGNIRFELYEGSQGNALYVVERYASQEAFEAHLHTPENAEVNARIGEVLNGGGGVLQFLDPIG